MNSHIASRLTRWRPALQLWLLLTLVGLHACAPAQSDSANAVRSITPQQAREQVDRGAVLLDVRSEEEWQQGHLQAARHVPISRFAEQVASLEMASNTPIILHCRSGGRASQAAEILQDLGYSRLAVVKPGGYSELLDAGLIPAH